MINKFLPALLLLSITGCGGGSSDSNLNSGSDTNSPSKPAIENSDINPDKPMAKAAEVQQCDSILAQSILDEVKVTPNFGKRLVLKKWLCGAEPQQVSAQLLDELNNELTLGPSSMSSLATWQENTCQDTDNNYTGTAASYILFDQLAKNVDESVIDSTTMDNWQGCLSESSPDGLICYAQVSDKGYQLTVKVSQLVGPSQIKLFNQTNLTLLGDKASRLTLGENIFEYSKEDVTKVASISLQAESDNFNIDCDYIIPTPALLSAPDQRCEDVRITALQENKINMRDYDYMRIKNMVPKINPKTNVYTGELRCSQLIEN
ncbi:hypothetical protein HQQ94_19260 [Shewanella sp. VB17]|uniref:hypothetical protein n=1 Tax=Shewanella sp. VB17 TaxID=2739432 RepID=UPI0015670D9A|nr:hypothetical protein [Shewanella sp. VB17]NRD75323.1 hypothetical protein [Shewanella sp. VB17]